MKFPSDKQVEKLKSAFESEAWKQFSSDSNEIRYLQTICELDGDANLINQVYFPPNEFNQEYDQIRNAFDKLENAGLIFRKWEDKKVSHYHFYPELKGIDLVKSFFRPGSKIQPTGYLHRFDIPSTPGRKIFITEETGLPDFESTFRLDDMVHLSPNVSYTFNAYIRRDGSLVVTISPGS